MEFTRLAVKGVMGSTVISSGANVTLTEEQKAAQYIGITLSAASKTVTLGLPDGAVAIVVNEGGTNAFTLKNVSGDSGTSIAAGEAYLVRASTTANASKLTQLVAAGGK
jgi:hypothetical protein